MGHGQNPGDLLAGVEVPCSVPFQFLEYLLDGLYEGRLTLSSENLEPILTLSDAMIVSRGWPGLLCTIIPPIP